MSKFLLSVGLTLSALVGFGGISHGFEPAQPTEAGATLAQSTDLAQTTNYVGKLVNIMTSTGESYPRVPVIGQDNFALTIRFQNVPHAIPWRLITNIQVVGFGPGAP
jgi:hypothetical protein